MYVGILAFFVIMLSFSLFFRMIIRIAFAMTLLVWHREECLACKKSSDEVMVWLSVWTLE